MSPLEKRVKKLEDRGGHTTQLRIMTDEQLKRIVLAHLIVATLEEIETDLVEHPKSVANFHFKINYFFFQCRFKLIPFTPLHPPRKAAIS
ncbi:MAG: hypothetical protein P9F75_04685 [Candidatus Contendobacter sp.]|nr:hypothetical protein [Candidatus Contendobacter sp.]